MDFPFKTRPYAHQLREFLDHRESEARALLWQMRSGKSKVVVDTACHLKRVGKIDGVLVLATNGVHSNWARREFPAHAWDCVPFVAHAWRSSHPRKADAEEHDRSLQRCLSERGRLPVLCVNSESIIHERTQATIRAFYKRRRVMLVVDESHDFRSPSSRRSRVARGLRKHSPYRRILTGTAVANSPLAAWAQYEILAEAALGFENFGPFKDEFAVYAPTHTKGWRSFPQLTGYKNLDRLCDRMAKWSSVVLREDCADLPPIMPVTRGVGMSERAAELYARMGKELAVEIADGRVVEGLDGSKRLMKMQQCLSGFVIDEQGDVHSLGDENPRVAATVAEVEGTPGKAIVWCQFREDIRRVTAALREAGVGFVEYHGAVPAAERETAIDRFQGDPSVKAFVGHPRAGGQGLNLSAAECIIWHSHTHDLIVRDQANERATVVGGRSIPVVDLAAPGSVDEFILEKLAAKRSVSDELAGNGMRELLRFLTEMGI